MPIHLIDLPSSLSPWKAFEDMRASLDRGLAASLRDPDLLRAKRRLEREAKEKRVMERRQAQRARSLSEKTPTESAPASTP